MKLIDAIKLEGNPVHIPDCSRNDLPELFKELGYKVGVEIGCFRGSFTQHLCASGLKMYAVDPWVTYKGFQGNRKGRWQEKYDESYEVAKRRLAPYGDNCVIIKKMSADAAKDFEDESIDFVYIDGNHDFKFVVEDIYEWSYKVKKGGIISGHDYDNVRTSYPRLRVKLAVNSSVEAYGIKNWYVIGRKTEKEGEVRDRTRSWFWFKE